MNICVVNVHPVKQDTIPQDHDGVVNRKEDITYSDRTEREEQALLLISDFVDLARELIKIAKDKGVKDDVINSLLERKTMNHGMAIRPRNTISNKIFDFSSKTIKQLKESGYNNTLDLSDIEYRGELLY